MKSAEVRTVVDEKYGDYQNQVIEKFRGQGGRGRPRPKSKANGHANGAAESSEIDAWELLRTQLREEGGIFFDVSTEKVRSLCVRLVKSLPLPEIKLLWLRTDAYMDYDGLDFPDRPSMEEGVWEELNQAVFRAATAAEAQAPAAPVAETPDHPESEVGDETQIGSKNSPTDSASTASAAPSEAKKGRKSKPQHDTPTSNDTQPTLDL